MNQCEAAVDHQSSAHLQLNEVQKMFQMYIQVLLYNGPSQQMLKQQRRNKD